MYWHDLRRLDRDTLRDATLQTHYALQWLGRVGRAYGGKVVGTGSGSLRWHDAFGGFITEELPDGVAIGLRIEDLTFVTSVEGEVYGTFSLDGADDETAGEWVAEQFDFLGFDTEPLTEPLPYKMPRHAIGDGATYDPISGGVGFIELARWLTNGWSALSELRERLQEQEIRVSPIRCWPHRFILSLLIIPSDNNEDSARRIQVGMCPWDESNQEPYFYVSPRPGLEPANLPEFIDIGQWRVNGVVDAVAPASHFVGDELQETYVRRFLDSAVSVGWERLTQ